MPEHGDPARGGPHAGQQFWTFQQGEDNVPEAFGACGGGDRPLIEPFALDARGKTVHLGPFAYPLRDRPDILARMRSYVVSHDKEPHQEAVPLSLTGQPRGSDRLAGMGAHLARFWGARDGGQSTPRSYVLMPDRESVAGLEAESIGAAGLHPGAARPLLIRLMANSTLAAQLARPGAGTHRSQSDAALSFYTDRYASLLEATAGRARSTALEDYHAALQSLRGAPELAATFPPDVLAATSAEMCGEQLDVDVTGMGVRLAAHLANQRGTRYVGLVETGLIEASCGAYDTHQFHVRASAVSVTHLFRTLAAFINEPGEKDPRKIDLDRHLVLLTTEMGRTPYPQAGSDGNLGLNHWPYGYVTAALGGFVSPDLAGVVGAIGETGHAVEFATPSELRAAMLLANGVWPFSNEGFNVGNVRDAVTEADAAERLRTLLGLS